MFKTKEGIHSRIGNGQVKNENKTKRKRKKKIDNEKKAKRKTRPSFTVKQLLF